ncbi:MAG: cell division protein FtsX [Gammaproteobacteria bacterium]|jgi:putative ABC transport system permease protein|nr:cell division protein FtsX [Gammaproteobacteria bacterium]MDP6654067.1 cell division protein FtsX [Gammaproteobacteria bacterium]
MIRNKLGVILITLQIAFTMTVVINAIFIINERSRLMARPSGLDEANTFFLTSVGFGDDFNEAVTVADDLAALRQTPGVVNATVTNAIPVSGSGSNTGVRLVDDETAATSFAAYYRVDEHAIETMDLELIAGRNFAAQDIQWRQGGERTATEQLIISRQLASTLFPEREPNGVLGETLFTLGSQPHQVIGIVEQLQGPWPANSSVELAMLQPMHAFDGSTTYLIRTEPGERDRSMVDVEEMLVASNGNRLIRNLMSLQQTREESYQVDSAMSTILWVVIITLVFITCMGIVGLAVFGINRRRKQIGTRRALGATRTQILRYFMVSGIGVALGAVLTIGFSILLTSNFNMPVMAWYYTPLGMLALVVIGQLAVLGPSSGAARTEPAIATRSV